MKLSFIFTVDVDLADDIARDSFTRDVESLVRDVLPATATRATLVNLTPTPCAPRVGEPFFVLLGRDPVAGSVVDSWATRRLNNSPGWRPNEQEQWKIESARRLALEFYTYTRNYQLAQEAAR